MRGLDTLTAVGLCAEVGDFASFRKPAQLMSYLGLVPSETSSGQQRRLGSITKTGSTHARRLLVEAAWHYRKRPRIGTTLTERQAGQPPEAILHRTPRRRGLRLVYRKPGRDPCSWRNSGSVPAHARRPQWSHRGTLMARRRYAPGRGSFAI